MEIGGIGSSGGFSNQDLRRMREAMAEGERSRSVSSSPKVTPSTSPTSIKNNSSSLDLKPNTTQESSFDQVNRLVNHLANNQEKALINPTTGLAANAYRFAIDQAVRHKTTANTSSDLLNINEANNINKAAKPFEATVDKVAATGTMGITDTVFASALSPSLLPSSSKRSLATSNASAITSKYTTQSQVPVLNSFKPVDKYI